MLPAKQSNSKSLKSAFMIFLSSHFPELHANTIRWTRLSFFKKTVSACRRMEKRLLTLLKSCASFKSLKKGMNLHANIIKIGLNSHPSIETALVIMYLKSGSPTSASQLFDKMSQRNPIVQSAMISALSMTGQISEAKNLFEEIDDPNVVCWNAMINGYARNRYDIEGLKLFAEFQNLSMEPSEFTLCNIVTILANLSALEEGKQIHAFIIKKRLALDLAVSNSMISLYSKCGYVAEAKKYFDRMREKDVYSWTAMVTGYAQNNKIAEALEVFYKMPGKNTISWNSIISGYQWEGNNEKALELFSKMLREGEFPNSTTISVVLKCCVSLCDLEKGKEIHSHAIKSGSQSNVFVGSTLVDMYAKCGDLADAQGAFDEILEQNVVSWSVLVAGYARHGKIIEAEALFIKIHEKNVISYNVMIMGYVQNGLQAKAIHLFINMIKTGIRPNQFTLSSLLNGCSCLQAEQNGKKFHGYTVKLGFESETSVSNSLITMYGEQRNIKDACLVFKIMSQYDVISWTAIINAYIINQETDEARKIFDRMPMKNLISWNTMIFGYLQNGKITNLNRDKHSTLHNTRNPSGSTNEALELYCKMEKSEIKPDHFTYNCALTACANTGALDQARLIHAVTIQRGFEFDVGVGNALITTYGKCGCLSDGEKIFKNMSKHDIISWNTLITGYAQNGEGNRALDLFEKMLNSGIEPNHVTYISILSACSHIGEVKKGWRYFCMMTRDHGIQPSNEHYACMVDLLGRSGYLQEAEIFIKSMELKPDSVVWGALLGACKIHGDPVLARRVAEKILHMEPNNSAAHITLSNVFATAGLWEDASEVRAAMKEKQLQKSPGCSWIDIQNHRYLFFAGDNGCSEGNFPSTLHNNMKEEGYSPDQGFSMSDFGD